MVAVVIDLGHGGRRSGRFFIDGSFSQKQIGAPVIVRQMGGPLPGDPYGNTAENTPLLTAGWVQSTRQIVVSWASPMGPPVGRFRFAYLLAV